MKMLLISCTFFALSQICTGQHLDWVQQYSSTASDRASKVIHDQNGNVYIGGSFNSTMDFDVSSNDFLITSYGQEDAFITKLDREDLSETFRIILN